MVKKFTKCSRHVILLLITRYIKEDFPIIIYKYNILLILRIGIGRSLISLNQYWNCTAWNEAERNLWFLVMYAPQNKIQ